MQNLGVSVERMEEGLKALEYPNVATLQVIFNLFRQRPADLLFQEAKRRDVGIIVRVPLAAHGQVWAPDRVYGRRPPPLQPRRRRL